jgi:hypothetical protein
MFKKDYMAQQTAYGAWGNDVMQMGKGSNMHSNVMTDV